MLADLGLVYKINLKMYGVLLCRERWKITPRSLGLYERNNFSLKYERSNTSLLHPLNLSLFSSCTFCATKAGPCGHVIIFMYALQFTIFCALRWFHLQHRKWEVKHGDTDQKIPWLILSLVSWLYLIFNQLWFLVNKTTKITPRTIAMFGMMYSYIFNL